MSSSKGINSSWNSSKDTSEIETNSKLHEYNRERQGEVEGGGECRIPHFSLLYHVFHSSGRDRGSALSISCLLYSQYPLGEQGTCTFHFLHNVHPIPPGGTGGLHFPLTIPCTSSHYPLRWQGVCTFHFLCHVLVLSPEGKGGGLHYLLTIQCTPSPLGGAGGLHFPLCKPCTLTTPWGQICTFHFPRHPWEGEVDALSLPTAFTPIHPSLVTSALVHHISVAKFYAIQVTLLRYIPLGPATILSDLERRLTCVNVQLQ